MPRPFSPRDPISCVTHLIGAGVSLVATVLILLRALLGGTPWPVMVGAILFGASLVALYLSSGVYHYANRPPQALVGLRKLDHAMIYVLIAGSYSPFILGCLEGRQQLFFLVLIWAIAAVGIGVKLFWLGAPRWLSTCFYIGMGWVGVLFLPSLIPALGRLGMTLLVTGGVLYTVGGVIYIVKWPNLPGGWGFHELFHLFVIGGSLCHFFTVFYFLL